MIKIGVTERGDPGIDYSWINKANEYDGLILITKRLSDKFIEDASNVNSIVHATITGYGGTIFEPGVPTFIASSILFKKLVERLTPDRVVLRIDPIFPNNKGMITALRVYEDLHVNFEKKTRVRISFMDNYLHVKQRFRSAGIPVLRYFFHAPLEERKRIASFFPDADICGEPGFMCVGCVSERDLDILKIKYDPEILPTFKGAQRKECTCLSVKREIFKERKRCPNQCLYCYWK